jgi:hypothetical protein
MFQLLKNKSSAFVAIRFDQLQQASAQNMMLLSQPELLNGLNALVSKAAQE